MKADCLLGILFNNNKNRNIYWNVSKKGKKQKRVREGSRKRYWILSCGAYNLISSVNILRVCACLYCICETQCVFARTSFFFFYVYVFGSHFCTRAYRVIGTVPLYSVGNIRERAKRNSFPSGMMHCWLRGIIFWWDHLNWLWLFLTARGSGGRKSHASVVADTAQQSKDLDGWWRRCGRQNGGGWNARLVRYAIVSWLRVDYQWCGHSDRFTGAPFIITDHQ